ncbi:MAG: arginase family protein [Polyangiales bacterium]
MNALEELATILRPAAGGLYVVSTGRAQQLEIQRQLYGVDREEDVNRLFRDNLEKIARAKVVILGVPSDVGAGFLRGANLGPQAIRAALLAGDKDYRAWMDAHDVVDVGDVFVVPQLLHDDMLSDAQIAASRASIYPGRKEPLPVSPLSIEERALDLIFSLNPRVAPMVLGGDHSTAWPVASALSRVRKNWGIVQPDAHTDLLSERLGVKYCFATWSYHANDLIGRGGRMVQVGTRASRRDREHWESTLGVRQFWGEECRTKPAESLDAILAHLKKVGVSSVYFSNDIDGTDEAHVDATGTPEPGGLEPDFVIELIRRLGREIGLCAGDVMEVAPPVQRTADGAARTTALAARYVRETLDAILQ